MRVSTASAFLFVFYTIVLLIQTDQLSLKPPPVETVHQLPPPPPRLTAMEGIAPLKMRRSVGGSLSAIWDGWASERIKAKKPVRLVVAGMSASGADWLTAALKIILEEAPRVHGQTGPVQVVSDACKGHTYCIVNAPRFLPATLAEDVFQT